MACYYEDPNSLSMWTSVLNGSFHHLSCFFISDSIRQWYWCGVITGSVWSSRPWLLCVSTVRTDDRATEGEKVKKCYNRIIKILYQTKEILSHRRISPFSALNIYIFVRKEMFFLIRTFNFLLPRAVILTELSIIVVKKLAITGQWGVKPPT